MKIDRHYNPYEDLENTLIVELEGIVKQLGGKMSKSTRHDYTGKHSKIITIEYDIIQS